MLRRTTVSLVLAAVVATVGLVTATSSARQSGAGGGKGDVGQTAIPLFAVEKVDVREALRDLFKKVGTSYSIAPEVQGEVTLSLKATTFQVALRSILAQVDATYRVVNGVYQMIRWSAYGDSQAFIIQLTGLSAGDFFRRLKTAQVDYRVEGGIYQLFDLAEDPGAIKMQRQPGVPSSIRFGSGPVPEIIAKRNPDPSNPSEATIAQDAKYIFILRGNELIKVEKATLKVLKRSKI